MAAAPQRRPRYRTLLKSPVRGRGIPGGAPGRAPKWKQRREVLLMLGSVYVHTVAAGLGEEVARLEEQETGAEDEGERLEVKITELSEPGRIRALAKRDLDMRDPAGRDLEVYDGSDGEDVVNGGGEKKEIGE